MRFTKRVERILCAWGDALVLIYGPPGTTEFWSWACAWSIPGMLSQPVARSCGITLLSPDEGQEDAVVLRYFLILHFLTIERVRFVAIVTRNLDGIIHRDAAGAL